MKKISLLAIGALLFTDASAMKENEQISELLPTSQSTPLALAQISPEELIQNLLQLKNKYDELQSSDAKLVEYKEKISQIVVFLSLYAEELEKQKSKAAGCCFFKCLDMNGDGKVDRQDLKALLEYGMGIKNIVLSAISSGAANTNLANSIIDGCYDFVTKSQTTSTSSEQNLVNNQTMFTTPRPATPTPSNLDALLVSLKK
ncbi:MAG: hypothetical protein LBP41_01605 [Holosporaceae bacterium]|jgi:hypothetical protein|nr:hypothetical protein [Holosporaceae bacterium]